MQLKDWIIETGPKKAARLLGVEPQTVSQWRVGKALPRPENLVAIFKLSKGKVTYKEMIERFARARK